MEKDTTIITVGMLVFYCPDISSLGHSFTNPQFLWVRNLGRLNWTLCAGPVRLKSQCPLGLPLHVTYLMLGSSSSGSLVVCRIQFLAVVAEALSF